MEHEIKILFNTAAKGARHKHYAHTVKKAELYRKLITGEGLDDLLRKYAKREDDELFDQRKRLTNHIVTAIAKNLLDVWYKVPRSNTKRRTLRYDGNKAGDKKKELENVLGKFWGDSSFDDYMAIRFIELNATDPNAFVVFEFGEYKENERLQPYPYEVPSRKAVNYGYTNNVLQYLITEEPHAYESGTTIDLDDSLLKETPTTIGKKYTLYRKNDVIQIKETGLKGHELPTEGAVVDGLVRLGEKVYEYIEYLPHNLGKVPAFRVGYNRDGVTNGETFVNPLHAIEPILKKTIKTNSELDLVALNLAFPQMAKYKQRCHDNKCLGGSYADGSICSTCGGTGLEKTAPNSQDAILLPFPKSKDVAIPLDGVVAYSHPPTTIVEWQEQYLENLNQKAKKLLFNSDVFDRVKNIDQLGSKLLDMQNVYDTLYPFSVGMSKKWAYGVDIIAGLTELKDDLVRSLRFSKDFKLMTLDMLVMNLSIANNIGNQEIKSHIQDDIALILFDDDPIGLQRYRLKQLLNPTKGKTESETLNHIGSQWMRPIDKVLHTNYSFIWNKIELETPNFYKLKKEDQIKKLYEVAQVIKDEIEAENPTPTLEI